MLKSFVWFIVALILVTFFIVMTKKEDAPAKSTPLQIHNEKPIVYPCNDGKCS